jgi:hypothetical protein
VQKLIVGWSDMRLDLCLTIWGWTWCTSLVLYLQWRIISNKHQASLKQNEKQYYVCCKTMPGIIFLVIYLFFSWESFIEIKKQLHYSHTKPYSHVRPQCTFQHTRTPLYPNWANHTLAIPCYSYDICANKNFERFVN